MRNAKRIRRAKARQASRVKTGLVADSFSALLTTNKGKVKRPSHGASPAGRHKVSAHLSKVAMQKIGRHVKPTMATDDIGSFRLDTPAVIPSNSRTRFEPPKIK